MSDSDIQHTVDAVWRMEAAKIVATLTRAVGDVGLAEDLAADALVDALEQWPTTGVPRNAAAWLVTVAKRKAIDHWRRRDRLDAKYATLARELETHLHDPTAEASDPDRIDDDVLRLMFISAHPVLVREGRIALTLRVVGGLTTDEIAQAFLVPKATIAQRIVRAKKTLGEANVPFEVPDPSEYPGRLSAVLSVIYPIYNEGCSASSGQRWIRDELCTETLRLGRVLTALVPDEAEVHGLVALMEFQSSRFRARTAPEGRPVLLECALQAALAECHAAATTAADTDWSRIVSPYDGLVQIAPSPVVELNRAVAVAILSGPAEALTIIDQIGGLADSYLLPSVRGELLSRLGRQSEAAAEFERAATMATNDQERDVLVDKAERVRA